MKAFTAMEEEPKLTIIQPVAVSFRDRKPDYTITFHRDGKQIGCFDFNQTPATFVGDVDASARVFVDAVLRMFPPIPQNTNTTIPAQPI